MSESDLLRMIGDGVSVANRNRAIRRRRPPALDRLCYTGGPCRGHPHPSRAVRSDYEGCVELQRRCGAWRPRGRLTIQLIARHSRGTVHVRRPRRAPRGLRLPFPALRGGSPHLHSDMLAVLPGVPEAWVGVRLKLAQREEPWRVASTSSPGPSTRCRHATRSSTCAVWAARDGVPGERYGITSSHCTTACPRTACSCAGSCARLASRSGGRGEPPATSPRRSCEGHAVKCRRAGRCPPIRRSTSQSLRCCSRSRRSSRC